MSNANWQPEGQWQASGPEPHGNAYDPGFNPAPHPQTQQYGAQQPGYQQYGGPQPGYQPPLNAGQIPPGSMIPVSPQEYQAEKSMASFSHWGSIFVGWVAGLIGLLAKPAQGGRYQEVHAKESLNFSIVMLVGYMINYALMFLFIGFITILVQLGFDIYMRVKASGAAERGEMPAYWLPFRALN